MLGLSLLTSSELVTTRYANTVYALHASQAVGTDATFTGPVTAGVRRVQLVLSREGWPAGTVTIIRERSENGGADWFESGRVTVPGGTVLNPDGSTLAEDVIATTMARKQGNIHSPIPGRVRFRVVSASGLKTSARVRVETA